MRRTSSLSACDCRWYLFQLAKPWQWWTRPWLHPHESCKS
uniref:Uncharacterized protein n=1 Tax=Arundo donax TaxID=35708 RepID=A0A0A9AJ67_ARUDO